MKSLSLISILILAGCGADQLPRGQTMPQSPPGSQIQLEYDSPQVLLVNQAVKIVPEIADIAESQVIIDPPLPVGLVYDTTTGIISGTPTQVTAATLYTIGINNEVAGSGHGTVVIEVSDGPLFYLSPIAAQLGSPMTPETPRGTATLSNFSIAPPLPSGLTLNPTTGVLSGTPVVAQPATYYEISATDSSIRKVFGLTLGVIDSNASLAIQVPNGSTLACAYSGAFVGSFLRESQPQDEGLIEIAFTPDGKSQARIDDFGGDAIYDSDGTGGLSATLDGTFQFNLTDSVALSGHFSGEDYLSGAFTKDGVTTPFLAARLAGSPNANVRYTSKIDFYEVQLGALDRTGNSGTAVGYVLQTSDGEGLYQWNLQVPITAVFDPAAAAYSWRAPEISETGQNQVPASGFSLTLGQPYDDSLYLNMVGCQLN